MHKSEQGPNLFDFPPVSTWREVYSGRWNKLKLVQQIEFVVELSFCILFFGLVIYASYLRNSNIAGLVMAFSLVGVLLGVFFFLLDRSIR